jgi:glycosyltransferase involved in cell wall biosynthesis
MGKYNTNKISIAIPMQQHAFRTAEGLIKAGLLDRYYTTVYYKPKKLIYRILRIILCASTAKSMENKRTEAMDPFVNTYGELWGVLFIFSVRFLKLTPLRKKLTALMFYVFAKGTYKDIRKREPMIVWGFDSWARALFKKLKEEGCSPILVLDMASTATPTIKKIIDEEYDKHDDFYHTFERNRITYSESSVAEYIEEFKYADYFLAPSIWVNKSLINEGISEHKILMLPHGVDSSKFAPKPSSYEVPERLRFLFVGRVEGAKGIRYLFEAFKQLKDENVELIVVGNTFTWTEEVKTYSPNIIIKGMVNSELMPEVYQNADIFILSSLWEGSALSMLEAMSTGMPVIASSHSCAPDIITDGKEGFVYDPYDVDKLKEHILWYSNNKDKIIEMGKYARKTAEANSWDVYYENCAKVYNEILTKENQR